MIYNIILFKIILKMEEFQLFSKTLQNYNKQNHTQKIRKKSESNSTTCTHFNVVFENGNKTCLDCGQEIQKQITHDKEWRYYGNSDSKRSNDPNRVQLRKIDDRNIFKDVNNMGFSDKIIKLANQIYNETTNGKIFRGNSRKAIIFACIFHAYKLLGQPQSHEKLIRMFSINKKSGLKGLKHVNLNAPKNSQIHTSYITPKNLISDILDNFSGNIKQKEEVIEIYNKIKNKSSKINRSRPQSIAAGLVYYWMLKTKINITIKDFANKVNLSELTINKIIKEISKILNTPELVKFK
tara:strand:+ start:265 stop:1149 length:885 start_codon:yes stop_codon:yes gene_type:complete